MKFVPSWLQQMGQSAQGLPTLQGLPGAESRTLADVLSEMYSAQGDLGMADQMLNAQYAPNSGAAGGFALALQAFAGGKLRNQSEGKLSDLLREQSEMLSKREREELEREAERAQAEFERKVAAARKAQGGDSAEAIALGLKIPQQTGPKVMKVGNQLVQIGADGTPKVVHEAPQAAQAGPETPASIRELQAYMALSPEQQKAFDRLQGREVGQAQLSAKDQQANEMRGVSADNALNLLGQLETMTKAGVGGPVASLVPFKGLTNPQFEQYEAVRNQLVDEITRLRRVPGIGSQSDRELASLLAAIPGADTNEATRNAALANIRRVLTDIQGKIGNAGGGISVRADASGRTGDPLIDKYL